MALNNNAKVSDIITSLQDMQGINHKYELQSALNNKGVDATEDDSVAEMVNKLNTANLVLDGKKWASGTVYSDNYGAVTVGGLTFKPSIIVVYGTSNTTNATAAFYNAYQNSNQYIVGLDYRVLGNPYYVNTSGFYLQASGVGGTNFRWVAYE